MVEWKDTSSWSKSDSEETRLVPKSWTINFNEFRLVVHRHIDYDKDEWLVTCYPGLFRQSVLKNKEIDLAKIEAILLLKTLLNKAIGVIDA